MRESRMFGMQIMHSKDEGFGALPVRWDSSDVLADKIITPEQQTVSLQSTSSFRIGQVSFSLLQPYFADAHIQEITSVILLTVLTYSVPSNQLQPLDTRISSLAFLPPSKNRPHLIPYSNS